MTNKYLKVLADTGISTLKRGVQGGVGGMLAGAGKHFIASKAINLAEGRELNLLQHDKKYLKEVLEASKKSGIVGGAIGAGTGAYRGLKKGILTHIDEKAKLKARIETNLKYLGVGTAVGGAGALGYYAGSR